MSSIVNLLYRMTRKINIIILLFILTGIPTITSQSNNGQDSTHLSSKDIPVSFSFSFKTSHLWRGIDCSPSPYFSTELSISDKNKVIKVGIWNGLGTNGIFKEINHYLSVKKSGFIFELWDVYNFSTDASHNNKEYFNYNAKETGRFLDASVKYRFSGKYPIQFMWGTIFFGRDRGVLNQYNRYSTYIEVEYPIYRSNMINFDLCFGGAFAMRKGKNEVGKKIDAHFFGDKAGITNISLKASKDITICNYYIPVSVYGMWNPEGNRANVQVALMLFSM